jgi:rhodanese-related sulfurtransferase
MPQDIQRDRLQQLLVQGAAIVEVLPSKEFEQEHLPGAVNLPVSDVRAESAARVIGTDKQRPVVAYCQGSD